MAINYLFKQMNSSIMTPDKSTCNYIIIQLHYKNVKTFDERIYDDLIKFLMI